MSYGDDEIIKIVDDPIKECFNFVSKNFKDVKPFEIEMEFVFQIRFNENNFSKLPEAIKAELKKFAYVADEVYCDKVTDERYRKDFYWINSNQYIFTFNCDDAIKLTTKCEYAYGEMRSYKDEIIYIDKTFFTPFILNNIDLNPDEEPKLK